MHNRWFRNLTREEENDFYNCIIHAWLSLFLCSTMLETMISNYKGITKKGEKREGSLLCWHLLSCVYYTEVINSVTILGDHHAYDHTGHKASSTANAWLC